MDIGIIIDYLFAGVLAPIGCGNPSCSIIQKSVATQEDREEAQDKLDEAGVTSVKIPGLVKNVESVKGVSRLVQ